ncbi:Ycf48-like protein [Alphaproteobacteria bacterium SO-S41]|nr:Ycf48-like protein [Alphaproteobacteria bacterium SO-S41]
MTFKYAPRFALALLMALPLGLASAQDAAAPAAPAFAPGDASPSDLLMKSLLLGVARAGNRIVAVGEFGHVALSDDEGKTWRQAKRVPVETTLTSVTFLDANTGWAAGHDKTILMTADGGETWTVQYSREISAKAGISLEPRRRPDAPAATPAPEPAAPADGAAPAEAAPPAEGGLPVIDESAVDDGISTDDDGFVESDTTGSDVEADIPFLGLVFTSPTHGFAVGGFNYAVETNDAGKTWTPRRLVVTASDDFHLSGAFTGPAGEIFLPSEKGQVYRSLDNGTTWDIVRVGYEGSFWGGLGLKDGSVLAIGMRGNVWRSTDRGETWTDLAKDLTPESVAAGTQLADGTIVLVGIAGLVMTSKDNGASWDLSLSQADRKGLAAVTPGHDNMLLLFGEAGFREQALTKPQG